MKFQLTLFLNKISYYYKIWKKEKKKGICLSSCSCLSGRDRLPFIQKPPLLISLYLLFNTKVIFEYNWYILNSLYKICVITQRFLQQSFITNKSKTESYPGPPLLHLINLEKNCRKKEILSIHKRKLNSVKSTVVISTSSFKIRY